MSGVEREKIKSLIAVRGNSTKAKFVVLGKIESSSVIIRNLFDKNFNEDDLKGENLGVKNLNIEKDISISYSKSINELEVTDFECILYGMSLVTKRIDIDELDKIKEIASKSKNIILVLTDIEKLDLRELRQMKELITAKIENIEILTVMDLEIDSRYNQWTQLVISVQEHLNDNNKISFMKSQIIDNSFKNELCDTIVEFYIGLFNEIEVEKLSKGDLLYIQNNMISEILGLYPHSDEVGKAIIDLVERNVTEIFDIKREKLALILQVEEEERLRIEAEAEAQRKAEEERLRREEEARLAEEKRIREEEEARLAEERRLREEEEAKIKAEKERIRKEEEARLAEEKRLREEEEARIKAEKERIRKEEEARLAEEKRLREEEEARIKAEKERIRKEEEARLAEEKRLREEEEARLRAEKERLKKEEEERIRAEEERLKKEEEARIEVEKEARRKAREEERKEKLKQQRLDLIELKKLEEERKILNEKIRKLNKSLRKNPISDGDTSIDDMIIEASFTVDDSIDVEPKHAVNEIEARIDGIIYDAIATRLEELVEEVRDEIKEKLKDNSII